MIPCAFARSQAQRRDVDLVHDLQLCFNYPERAHVRKAQGTVPNPYSNTRLLLGSLIWISERKVLSFSENSRPWVPKSRERCGCPHGGRMLCLAVNDNTITCHSRENERIDDSGAPRSGRSTKIDMPKRMIYSKDQGHNGDHSGLQAFYKLSKRQIFS